MDGDADRHLAPKRGRLVAFTSGLENLHRVVRHMSTIHKIHRIISESDSGDTHTVA